MDDPSQAQVEVPRYNTFTELSPERPSDPWFLPSSLRREGSWYGVALKWNVPFLLTGSSLVLCWLMLDAGTYSYVHMMSDMQMPSADVHLADLGFRLFSRPQHRFDIAYFDMIAMFLPLSFTITAVWSDNLFCWAKTMFCHTFLQIGKGICSSITIVPDAAGWEACKERLGEELLDWHSQTHTRKEILVHGLQRLGGKKYRFCADMMYSGHTFFVTLYALALYEAVSSMTTDMPRCRRIKVLAAIITFAATYTGVEIVLMLMFRIHYTSDLLMSVLLTILVFSNPLATRLGKWWVWLGIDEAKIEAEAEAERGSSSLPVQPKDVI